MAKNNFKTMYASVGLLILSNFSVHANPQVTTVNDLAQIEAINVTDIQTLWINPSNNVLNIIFENGDKYLLQAKNHTDALAAQEKLRSKIGNLNEALDVANIKNMWVTPGGNSLNVTIESGESYFLNSSNNKKDEIIAQIKLIKAKEANKGNDTHLKYNK